MLQDRQVVLDMKFLDKKCPGQILAYRPVFILDLVGQVVHQTRNVKENLMCKAARRARRVVLREMVASEDVKKMVSRLRGRSRRKQHATIGWNNLILGGRRTHRKPRRRRSANWVSF